MTIPKNSSVGVIGPTGSGKSLDFVEAELPDGFDTNLAERGVSLSSGQRQRIGLAGALYHCPCLLILGEATSALEVATEAKLLQALRSLAGKLTRVIAAHRFSAVADCDQVVYLGVFKPPVSRRLQSECE